MVRALNEKNHYKWFNEVASFFTGRKSVAGLEQCLQHRRLQLPRRHLHSRHHRKAHHLKMRITGRPRKKSTKSPELRR